MGDADWCDAGAHSLGMLINGEATDETDARGRPIEGDTLLLLLNGGDNPVQFRLPARDIGGRWEWLIETGTNHNAGVDEESVHLQAHSLLLLRYVRSRAIVPPTATR
jgi:isoamylase